jgi:hypothetical protein
LPFVPLLSPPRPPQAPAGRFSFSLFFEYLITCTHAHTHAHTNAPTHPHTFTHPQMRTHKHKDLFDEAEAGEGRVFARHGMLPEYLLVYSVFRLLSLLLCLCVYHVSIHTHTHTHTHNKLTNTHYIVYAYISSACMCMCVCVCRERERCLNRRADHTLTET